MAKKKAKPKKVPDVVGRDWTKLGSNIGAAVDGDMLYLAIDLTADNGPTPGGFRRIASTHGNIEVPGVPKVRLGLNCYDRGE